MGFSIQSYLISLGVRIWSHIIHYIPVEFISSYILQTKQQQIATKWETERLCEKKENSILYENRSLYKKYDAVNFELKRPTNENIQN